MPLNTIRQSDLWSEYEEDMFDIYPQLENHRELLWPWFKVIWDWSLAVIVESQEQWLVYKISHNFDCKDMIDKEILNHEKFYLTLRQWIAEGVIPDYIRIPTVRHHPSQHGGVYSMEKIDGLTLKSTDIITNGYEFRKSTQKDELLSTLTDFDLKRIFVDDFNIDEEDFDFTSNSKAIDVLEDLIWTERYKKFLDTIEYLEQNGCTHKDLHNSNVMLDREWNIYIIDFWPNEYTN